MRPGPLEIILIITVIIAVAVIARILRTGRGAARANEGPTTDVTASPPGESRMHGFFNGTGFALIVAGVVALVAAVSLFRWLLQSYLWAFVLIAIGSYTGTSLQKKKVMTPCSLL
jgi:uncharacterized membrane protein